MNTSSHSVTGWLRLLSVLLTWWEPLSFAVAAAGAFNAIAVRGLPIVVVLLARLATTALCVAAGRALGDGRPAGVTLARAALPLSALVQVVATLSPYFPSNRPPGQAPLAAVAIAMYYGTWLGYVRWSRQVARLQSSR